MNLDLLVSILSFSLALLGGIVWLIRMEGRVNLQDRLLAEQKEHSHLRNNEFQACLIRLELKIDALWNRGHS